MTLESALAILGEYGVTACVCFALLYINYTLIKSLSGKSAERLEVTKDATAALQASALAQHETAAALVRMTDSLSRLEHTVRTMSTGTVAAQNLVSQGQAAIKKDIEEIRQELRDARIHKGASQ